MMGWDAFKIALVYVVVATTEVSFHWYAGTQDSATARFLQKAYFHLSPEGKPFVAGFVDLMLPGILLGVAAGTIAWRWRPAALVCCAMVLALGLVALWPFYATFLPWGRSPFWPDTYPRETLVGYFFKTYLKASTLCGVLAYFARTMTEHFKQQSK